MRVCLICTWTRLPTVDCSNQATETAIDTTTITALRQFIPSLPVLAPHVQVTFKVAPNEVFNVHTRLLCTLSKKCNETYINTDVHQNNYAAGASDYDQLSIGGNHAHRFGTSKTTLPLQTHFESIR